MRHHPGKPSDEPLYQKVRQTIREFSMLMPGESVLVGVSGGPDSICLFHILSAMASEMRLKLGIAHFNHCLRSEDGDCDEAFVRNMAERQNAAFFSKKEDVGKASQTEACSIEEAGRNRRHRFFQETAASHGFARIALGHNQGDNAEQVLMSVLRGSGPAGLGGIPPVRDRIIRPLIRVKRGEIADYLQRNRIQFRNDPSNTDPSFLRNRIRHQLIPLLEECYNPSIADGLSRMADIFFTERQWTDLLTEDALAEAEISWSATKHLLSVHVLRGFHPALTRRVLRTCIAGIKGDLRGISHAHITSVAELLKKPKDPAYVHLPGRIRITKEGAYMSVIIEKHSLRKTDPDLQGLPPSYRYLLHLETLPARLRIPEIGLMLRATRGVSSGLPEFPLLGEENSACLDRASISSPLAIRGPEPGDRFIPLGMEGHQRLSDFFINNRVARKKRPFFPVVQSGDDIVWLGGLRISEIAKLTSATREIVRLELIPLHDIEKG